MHEGPDGAIIHFQAALSQFRDQPAQGERLRAAAIDQPDPMLARNRPSLVAAHLARGRAARLTQAPDPVDRGADANAEALCRRSARHMDVSAVVECSHSNNVFRINEDDGGSVPGK